MAHDWSTSSSMVHRHAERRPHRYGGARLLAGKCFRIGHMGYITEKDIDDVLAALQQALPRLGCKPAGVL